MSLREPNGVVWERLAGGKVKEKWYNYIIILKYKMGIKLWGLKSGFYSFKAGTDSAWSIWIYLPSWELILCETSTVFLATKEPHHLTSLLQTSPLSISAVGDLEFLCSPRSTGETRNVKHVELALQRNTWLTCFLHRRLRMDVVNSLVTSALPVWSGHTWLPQTLLFVSVILPRALS